MSAGMPCHEFAKMERRVSSATEAICHAMAELGEAWCECRDESWRRSLASAYRKLKDAAADVGEAV